MRFSALYLAATLVIAFQLGCGGGGDGAGSATGTGGSNPPMVSATNQWTWVGGSKTATASGVYGTEGMTAAANVPGSRAGAVSWTDRAGNLWLLGGGQFDPLAAQGPLNDLWEYDPTSKEWTWVNGSSEIPGNQRGVYGTLGVASSSNVPGGRAGASSWIDAGNDLWLFGGDGYDSTGAESGLNDLWKFNSASKQWTWVTGSKTINALGEYGVLGTAAASNLPGARTGAVAWTDASGNFWLFGGTGIDANGHPGSFNDLWQVAPSSNQWTWISGGTTVGVPGVNGVAGTAAASNAPGSRGFGSDEILPKLSMSPAGAYFV